MVASGIAWAPRPDRRTPKAASSVITEVRRTAAQASAAAVVSSASAVARSARTRSPRGASRLLATDAGLTGMSAAKRGALRGGHIGPDLARCACPGIQ